MALSGLLGGGLSGSQADTKVKKDLWTGEQKKTAGSLYGGVLKPGFQQYPYSGQPTDIEQTGLSQLRQYAGNMPTYFGEAGGALSRALTGQGYSNIVDPAAAERLYQSIQQRTMQDILPQVMRGAANEANIGGMLRSGTGQKLVTDEIGRITNALAEQLATLKYEDERQRRDIEREREARQLQAVPQTGVLSSAEFGRIAPALQYGGLERDIRGTQFDNPLTRLALSFLGLRGQETAKGSTSQTGWDIGGKLGFGIT